MRRKITYPKDKGRVLSCNHGDLRICVVCQYGDCCPFSEDGGYWNRTLWVERRQEAFVLKRWFGGGQINEPYLWIDTYNQVTNKIAGTIKARIDSNCMYFVSVDEWSRYTDYPVQGMRKETLWSAVFILMWTACTRHVGGYETMMILVVEVEDDLWC